MKLKLRCIRQFVVALVIALPLTLGAAPVVASPAALTIDPPTVASARVIPPEEIVMDAPSAPCHLPGGSTISGVLAVDDVWGSRRHHCHWRHRRQPDCDHRHRARHDRTDDDDRWAQSGQRSPANRIHREWHFARPGSCDLHLPEPEPRLRRLGGYQLLVGQRWLPAQYDRRVWRARCGDPHQEPDHHRQLNVAPQLPQAAGASLCLRRWSRDRCWHTPHHQHDDVRQPGGG